MLWNKDVNTIHAIRPWDSPYGSLFPDKRYQRRSMAESQMDIDQCLACPKAECNNCKHTAKNRYGYAAQKAGA